jgi:uncharacterized Zn-binding protein involved in type VI secretion
MQPVAKRGDRVIAIDTPIIVVSGVAAPVRHPFDGSLDTELSPDVLAEHQAVAVVGSRATNQPAHVPIAGSFQRAPHDKAKVVVGSSTVLVNDKPIARNLDAAETCTDPSDLPVGSVIAVGTVLSG